MSPIGVSLRAAFVLAVVQLSFSWTTVAQQLGISRVSLVLLPTVVGYFLPFSLGLSVFALLLARVSERRALFLPRPEFVGPTIATVFVLPYGWYLATFTFSGPRIRDVAFQPLLVGVLFLVLMGSTFLAALVLTRRQRAKVRSFFWASSFSVLVLAAAIVNLAVLPNEYEPLHRFVSLVALIAAVGLGHELRPPRVTSRIDRAGPILSAAVVLSLVALAPATLQKSYAVSWFVEGENALSRYLPSLHPHREAEQIVSDDGSAPIGKVTIGTPAREAALREVRAGRKLPHLVVFSIDNVQADRVGAYGYRGNPTTPNIDRIARRGAVFREAYTLYPGTRVFLSSMLTGRRLPPFSVHKMPTDYQLRSLTRLLDEHGYHVLVKGVFELTASRRWSCPV